MGSAAFFWPWRIHGEQLLPESCHNNGCSFPGEVKFLWHLDGFEVIKWLMMGGGDRNCCKLSSCVGCLRSGSECWWGVFPGWWRLCIQKLISIFQVGHSYFVPYLPNSYINISGGTLLFRPLPAQLCWPYEEISAHQSEWVRTPDHRRG